MKLMITSTNNNLVKDNNVFNMARLYGVYQS